jgi:anti-sigma28 factor (negative regulator of flagellin synthesis)
VKISLEQVRKVAAKPVSSPKFDEAVVRLTDGDLVNMLVEKVDMMGDREEQVEALRKRVQSGNYQVSGEDIADAMVRRAIADRIS